MAQRASAYEAILFDFLLLFWSIFIDINLDTSLLQKSDIAHLVFKVLYVIPRFFSGFMRTESTYFLVDVVNLVACDKIQSRSCIRKHLSQTA